MHKRRGMKESDAQKERDRLEMERLKKENPQEYKIRLEQQELIFKQNEAEKKRERQMAAAIERKRREEEGEPEMDDEAAAEAERAKIQRKREIRTKYMGKKDDGSWLPYVLAGLFAAFLFFNVLNFFQKDKDKEDD